jgi:hypothetical protein
VTDKLLLKTEGERFGLSPSSLFIQLHYARVKHRLEKSFCR